MKKLSKLKLKDYHEISDSEMKTIVGGYSSYGSDCEKKACKNSSDCSGYCANIASPGIAGCIGSYCM